MKTRVYLSKSNHADAWTVREVRRLLETRDVEVVEYHKEGSKYGAKDIARLKECEYLILVPPEDQQMEDAASINVGRGQYDQVKDFTDNFRNWENVYTVDYTVSTNAYLYAVNYEQLLEKDYTENWGELANDNWNYDLEDNPDLYEYLTGIFPPKVVTQAGSDFDIDKQILDPLGAGYKVTYSNDYAQSFVDRSLVKKNMIEIKVKPVSATWLFI